ncbi:MAG: hypothetical protein LCH66_11335 [Actinobacteria bacterium]|nr:hypothetical protein [Actinomycetota bacterium]
MITRAEFLDVCDAALDAMVEVAESLGDDLVSTRLDVPGGNSVCGAGHPLRRRHGPLGQDGEPGDRRCA